jgi:hypothetical protein
MPVARNGVQLGFSLELETRINIRDVVRQPKTASRQLQNFENCKIVHTVKSNCDKLTFCRCHPFANALAYALLRTGIGFVTMFRALATSFDFRFARHSYRSLTLTRLWTPKDIRSPEMASVLGYKLG